MTSCKDGGVFGIKGVRSREILVKDVERNGSRRERGEQSVRCEGAVPCGTRRTADKQEEEPCTSTSVKERACGAFVDPCAPIH